MSKQTPLINNRNIDNVRMQINMKNLSMPYHATVKQSAGVLTDYDTFPYPRWYRGVYYSPVPIVSEREAGWRPRRDNCYRMNKPCDNSTISYPNHCFESACSVVYPCYPEYVNKFLEQQQLEVLLNKSCISQYR